MSIVFDFADINRRLNRKPEPTATPDPEPASAPGTMVWQYVPQTSVAELRAELDANESALRAQLNAHFAKLDENALWKSLYCY